jgi:glycosyltransferase involved in cell wall biosynthesis
MNILFCYQNGFFAENGGVQRFCSTLGEYLTKKDFNVYYVSLVNDYDFKKNNLNYFFDLPNKNNLYAKENVLFYHKLLKTLKIDVVINNEATNNRFDFFSTPKVLNIKHLAVFHTDPLFNLKNPKLFFSFKNIFLMLQIIKRRKILKNLVSKSDKLVFLSELFVQGVSDILHLSSDKICSIKNFVEIAENQCLKGKNNHVLYVGRLNKEKQVDLLLKAWKELCILYPNWNLIILGDGEEREFLNQYVVTHGLKRVKFEGKVNPNNYYNESKVIVLPSKYEGFGLVLIEAMAHGVVPVAFNNWLSLHDIIDKNCGIVINKKDEKGIVESLSNLLDNNDLINQLSLAAKEKSKQFDIDILGEKWLNLIKN